GERLVRRPPVGNGERLQDLRRELQGAGTPERDRRRGAADRRRRPRVSIAAQTRSAAKPQTTVNVLATRISPHIVLVPELSHSGRAEQPRARTPPAGCPCRSPSTREF